jgi:hypothetical protein
MFASTLKIATTYNEIESARIKHAEKIGKEKQASFEKGPDNLSAAAKAYYEAFPTKQGEIGIDDYYSATDEAIIKAAAGLANADFGGLHTERMGVSKAAQDVMRLLFLGPDWTASNVISAIKAVKMGKTTSSSGTGTILAGSEIEKKMYQHFWLRIVGRSIAITTAINLLFAGLDDENTFERLIKAKKRGKFNILKADISPAMHMLGGSKDTDYYMNITGHFLDPLKIAMDPLRMSYHKSSAVLKPVIEGIGGFDYAHRRPSTITQIGSQGLKTWESTRSGPINYAEAPAYFLDQIFQTLPIQTRNLLSLFTGKENPLANLMKTGAGLDVNRTFDKLNRTGTD